VSRVVVVGAGVGGLAAALRCARAGHAVTVVEAAEAPGGKAGRRELGGYGFDTGPSLLTMPWVFEELLGDALPELMRVEPVTRYRFADGSTVDLSADLPRALSALEAWSPGAGEDWARFLGVCAGMWRASVPFLTGMPPWPPRRPGPGDPAPDPRDLARVKPWHTLRTLARSCVRDPRLRMVVERFATYAGADPRRAPAALAVAGYVEHAYGAWHVRGGIYELVRALERELVALGGEVRYGARVEGLLRRTSGAVRGVGTSSGAVDADWVLWNGDALGLDGLLVRRRAPWPRIERSLSGFVTLLGVRGPTSGLAHHTIAFPHDYDAEFDDVFVRRRPVVEPTLYVSTSSITDPSEAPEGCENWFVLVNGPAGLHASAWEGYEEHVLARLAAAGLDPGDRVEVSATRSPADLERETGAVGGSIYGDAPHGRLGTLLRPGPHVRGIPNLLRVGGTAHPGGGLPLVALSGALAAKIVGPA
jgi:phytoene desaturase